MERAAILNAARAAGFDDARIVPCTDDVCKSKESAPFETKSILVLFSKYRPVEETADGRINVSAYYAASNAAYQKAGELAGRLDADGVPALRDSALPARRIALLAGGRMGKNGFYYHPQFGSLVHIQTVRLGVEARAEAAEPRAGCLDCGACLRACPTGAVTDGGVNYSICLRSHMDRAVPDGMKPFIYQLLGCEKCQIACPMNSMEAGGLPDFGLASTLRGETIGALKDLAGKNMARLVRIVSQAVIVAANRGDASVLPEITALAEDERFADACRYYLERTGRAGPKKD